MVLDLHKFDAIAVLGFGVSEAGELYPDAKARIKKAALLFRKRIAPIMILCGKNSGSLEFVPMKTEADAFREYAIALGVPKARIILEKRSNDTMSNFIFLKKICIGRGFGKIAVVTSDFHACRVRLFGRLIFGKSISFRVFPSVRRLSKEERQKRIAHEKEFIQYAEKNLKGIGVGDSDQIERIWKWYWNGFEKGRSQKTEWYKPKEYRKH